MSLQTLQSLVNFLELVKSCMTLANQIIVNHFFGSRGKYEKASACFCWQNDPNCAVFIMCFCAILK
jgi:hypothetical protein